jgi:hypothetical protein
MSPAHKEALARGRQEGRVVRRYLEALDERKPRRGPRRTPESVRARLAVVSGRLPTADSLTRLHLLQERDDLEAELERLGPDPELPALEAAFVAVARDYGNRKGIGFNAWRAAAVPAAVLTRAGISRAPGGKRA